MNPTLRNWHVRVQKLRAPYNFALIEYGYWSRVKPSKRILKRCDCKLINIPRAKRELNNDKPHLSLWNEG